MDGVENIPKAGVALVVKTTVSPGSGLLFKVIRAVIVDAIDELAAIADGLGVDRVKVPEVTTTDTDWLRVPQAAVIVAVPRSVPGVKVTVA
jgi:hypothetical protein